MKFRDLKGWKNGAKGNLNQEHRGLCKWPSQRDLCYTRGNPNSSYFFSVSVQTPRAKHTLGIIGICLYKWFCHFWISLDVLFVLCFNEIGKERIFSYV